MASQPNDVRRIVPTEEDFNDLIRGKVIAKDGLEIALSNIGWLAMEDAIRVAQMLDTTADIQGVKKTWAES